MLSLSEALRVIQNYQEISKYSGTEEILSRGLLVAKAAYAAYVSTEIIKRSIGLNRELTQQDIHAIVMGVVYAFFSSSIQELQDFAKSKQNWFDDLGVPFGTC